jgi:hypothetical protein
MPAGHQPVADDQADNDAFGQHAAGIICEEGALGFG